MSFSRPRLVGPFTVEPDIHEQRAAAYERIRALSPESLACAIVLLDDLRRAEEQEPDGPVTVAIGER